MKACLIFSFLLLEVANKPSVGLAQSPETFTAAGDMIAPRGNHTATLLFNGKVLITGGFSLTAFNAPLATAELYDPFSGTFIPAGNMTTPRAQHSATLLADGRVLISGGRSVSNGAFLVSAELYDPATGTFTATGDMIRPQGFFNAATLLGNGKVLIASSGDTAELFDPATGAFSATGAYADANPGLWVTATLLPDGRVLLTGCSIRCMTGTTELYDPSTGLFSLTGPMKSGWGNVNTATLLPNGNVLLAGNAENDGLPADVEVYVPAAGIFNSIGHTNGTHEFSAAALLPDGSVLIAGGALPGGSADGDAELYSHATGTFAFSGNMTMARHSHTATLLPDGTILIAGGFSNWPYPTSSTEIYKPAALQPAPAIFSLSGDGRGQGAILHSGTPQAASSSNPAVVGEALEIYLTGLLDGSVIPPQVSIDGRMAEVLWFGNTPGFAGLNQVNVRVPAGIAPGAAVPVRLTYVGRPSNEVTIGVQ